jgi:hypothetical protein
LARQPDTNYFTENGVVLAGVNGWKNGFGELSFGFYYRERKKKDKGYAFSGLVFLGTEIRPHQQTLWGPKLGAFFHGGHRFGPCGGLSAIYYTGFGYDLFMLRPEAGIHFDAIRLVYGYNHRISGNNYGAVSEHNVSLIFGGKLGRLTDKYEIKQKKRNYF